MTEAQTAIVLVTDLVGSTALRSEVGEDAAEELRRRHDEVLVGAVDAENGVVVKSLGDGILARFAGAASAIAAACAMQQQVDRRFDVRIGISAGDVTLENGDCFGAPVIEASRLCDRAEGGQVLVADLVRKLARGRGGYIFEPVGDLDLKGMAEPVTTGQVVWDESRYDRVRFPNSLIVDGLPFVGRERELETIARSWQQVELGATSVILISGEPGIGKTRLIARAAVTVREEGGGVLYGRCNDEAVSDYQAFTEALTPLITDLPDHVIEAHVEECGTSLVGLVPMLASRVPGLEQPASNAADIGSGSDEALADLLRRASDLAPVMLVLEDLHRARGGTAQMFDRLARNSDLGSVLIVGTYSRTEVRRNDPIRAAFSNLRRAEGIERIRLLGLNVNAVAELIVNAHDERTGDNGATLASEIHRQTDGSPFFIEEALRKISGSGTTFRLERSTRMRLGITGAAGLVVSVSIVVVAAGMGGETSALQWFVIGGAAAFFAVAGSWLLAQLASQVVIAPGGLTVTATGRLKTTSLRWDEIEAIRWRPPTKWTADRDGGFFIETVGGQQVSNPLIDHPTREFAQAMYIACQRHHVNDIAIRAKWPKLRTTPTADGTVEWSGDHRGAEPGKDRLMRRYDSNESGRRQHEPLQGMRRRSGRQRGG